MLTYCANYFMMYVSQIIMLYTLNFYSAICQLYLNKSGTKKKLEQNSRTTTKSVHGALWLYRAQ